MKRPITNTLRSTVAVGSAIVMLASSCGSSGDTATTSEAPTSDVLSSAAPTSDVSTSVVSPSDVPPTSGAIDTTSPAATTNPTDGSGGLTVAGIAAAQWADNVEITIGADTVRYVSNGIPSHELPDQFLIPNDGNMPPFDGDDVSAEFSIVDTADLIQESPIDVEITLNPVYSETVTQTNLGQIGVMISGAQLFNDYEDQTLTFVALDDNLSLDGVFFIDACNGHPLQAGNDYHYHGIPYCLTDDVDVAGQHSTILGLLLDGFPVYGAHDVDGSTLTNADLDECSGHVGPTPEFPEGIYHYHLTEDASPYSIDCFHGVVDISTPDGRGGPPGAVGNSGPPDLSTAALQLGVSVEALQSALGQPPFDLDAVAATLGVTVEDLAAAIPAPPGS